MSSEGKKAWKWSFSLHVVLLTLLLFGPWLWKHLMAETPPPTIFELVDLAAPSPSPSPSPETPPAQTVETPPTPLRLPELEQLEALPEVALQPIEAPPPPPPPPVPKPEPKPAPKPPPPPPEPTPAPRVDYSEWAKNRNLPKEVQQRPAPQRRPVEVPQIETNVQQRLQDSLSGLRLDRSSVGSHATENQIQSYLAALSARLQAAFQPIGTGLQADVAFEVFSDGRIGNMRIIRSSGDSGFDNAVRGTFQRVASPGPPPGGQTLRLTLTFRSVKG